MPTARKNNPLPVEYTHFRFVLTASISSNYRFFQQKSKQQLAKSSICGMITGIVQVHMEKRMTRRMILILSGLLLATVLISACTGGAPSPTAVIDTATVTLAPPPATDTLTPLPPTDTPEPSPTATATEIPPTAPVVYGPSNFPPDVNPLTGQIVADITLLERRPLAVKVQMFPRGQRPPWGVSLANIVYDYYQNFGLTRFHAIFYGEDAEIVGPIRSARLLDLQLVNMYKTIFAFGSAEQRTYSKLFGTEFAPRLVVEGKAKCPPMCRLEPNTYNYLVTNTSELETYAEQQGVDNVRQNLDGMSFAAVPPANGQIGQQVFVRHSISAYHNWSYDLASGRYLRSQDTQEANDLQSEAYAPLTDRLNGQQIAADNVVVLIATHKYAFGSQPGPNEVIEIMLSGSGPAYAFRDGQVYQVTWNRPATNSVLFLTLPDGTPYAFKPGNTWFEVIGKSSKITNEPAGTWRYQHAIP
jgi:hypothetical protein